MDRDAVVRRFGHRPGYELVTHKEVALPVLLLRLKALTIEAHDVPALHQFVLRAVEQGLDQPEQVAGLLGLEERVAVSVMADLLGSDDLLIAAPGGGERKQRLVLTPKARGTLRELKTRVPAELVLPVYMDGLTGTLSVELQLRVIRPEEAKRRGLIEVPPASRKRVEIEDIPLDRLIDAMARGGVARAARRNVLGLLGLVRRERWFWEDCLALGFRSMDGRSVQVGFAVNGQLSIPHEEAYARAFGERPVGLLAELRAGEPAPMDFPGFPRASAEEVQEAVAVREQLIAAEAVAADLESVLTVGGDTGDEDTTGRQLADARHQVEQLEARLAEVRTREVSMPEHPQLLDRALTNCQRRLMIISPWVTTAVVGGLFVDRLEAALKRGAEIYIGYGTKDRHERLDSSNQELALRKLRRLADGYKNFHLVRLGDTHAKVLVCDNAFVVTSSFNWLSFAGDPDRTFRDERGLYTSDPAVIEREFDHHRERMVGAQGD